MTPSSNISALAGLHLRLLIQNLDGFSCLLRREDWLVITIDNTQYDVVWSPVYDVPVLYCLDTRVKPQPPTMLPVSLTDHPILNQPSLYVHPCDTLAWLSTIQQTNHSTTWTADLLLGWLSFVGPSLNMPTTKLYLSR